MKHVLIRDNTLNGWEFGMLRSFEETVIEVTGAEVIELPKQNNFINKKLDHGMRWSKFRRYLFKSDLLIDADVIWCILMGPENYKLDLFKKSNIKAKYRILYLFDTLDHQLSLCTQLFSNNFFNIKITSFIDAVSNLEKVTGQKWFCVDQGISNKLFYPEPFEKRLIHFSSYGRSLYNFNKNLYLFCKNKDLYFDTTTHNSKSPTALPEVLYEQYAWHMRHSLFSVSWPVEITNQIRAGSLSPITCRWFEAASCGTIIIGKKPINTHFEHSLCKDIVNEIDPSMESKRILYKLDELWEQREELFEKSIQQSNNNIYRWSWQARVSEIINIMCSS